jgi:hypothetical protein
MHSIKTTSELKDSIRLLEDKRSAEMHLLKTEFNLIVESLKPANIIKRSVSGISSSPHIMRNILIAISGLATAYVSRKKLIKSSNPARKLLVTIAQAGIASFLAVKGEEIKEKAYIILKSIFRRKSKVYEQSTT